MRTILCCLLAVLLGTAAAQESVRVGSKRFTESYVLGEIAKKVLTDAGYKVEHKQGMGGTIILWQALTGSSIDMYPEYTGTISEEIMKSDEPLSIEDMRQGLAPQGIGVTDELGFNNTYALVMKRPLAEELGITKISDLADHPDLVIGPTHEFLDRQDGWRPLAARYGLNPANPVVGIDHNLGYQALAQGDVAVKDAYSTDAAIAENDLVVLEDDLGYFPQYNAVFVYRLDAPPVAIGAIKALAGTIDESKMIEMNAQAENTKDFTEAASLYFEGKQREEVAANSESASTRILRQTADHIKLVGISMLVAILIGLPLGIIASRPGPLSQIILGFTGILQTIPSLALLALLVPIAFLGTSITTAVVALFLYSLLPIVRNTATGLQDIPVPIRESAAALGLEKSAQLTKVLLPIASPTILAGIKTAAVINVGTATLAALIGAGGLGESIIGGLALSDNVRILQGAVPAALLAVAVQFGFEFIDQLVIPRGLKLGTPGK